jgi:hypothetical protein
LLVAILSHLVRFNDAVRIIAVSVFLLSTIEQQKKSIVAIKKAEKIEYCVIIVDITKRAQCALFSFSD